MQRNVRAWLGLVEDDDQDDDALVNEDRYGPEDGYGPEDVSQDEYDDDTASGELAVSNGVHIAIVRPRNFRDAVTIGEYFREEIPVIINLEDMDNAEAWRIIDFASGLILGLRGDIERISRRTFLIVPADATMLTTPHGLTEESFFYQALRLALAPVRPRALVRGGERQ